MFAKNYLINNQDIMIAKPLRLAKLSIQNSISIAKRSDFTNFF